MILNLFKLLGVDKPTYLDLGAHHPYIISNTALLYERGSRGVNVEANPNLIAEFNRVRPEDTNVNVGVGLRYSESNLFYMYSDSSGRNTFSPVEVETLKGRMTVQKTIELKMLTLTQIVHTFCGGNFPDLLSVDIEGLDYEVLWSADFSKSRPMVIVVETRKQETGRMIELLDSRGYFPYCRMGENLFFLRFHYKPLVY